jgi:hypothetical protein
VNPIQPPPPMTYQHLQAENEYLKHNLQYAHQVAWHNQQSAQSTYVDAMRWRKFKELLDVKGPSKSAEVEARIDAALKGVKE